MIPSSVGKSIAFLVAFLAFSLTLSSAGYAFVAGGGLGNGEQSSRSDVHHVAKVPRDLGPVSKQIIDYETREKSGTILISNSKLTLIHVLGGGKAAKYKISVGRDGFTWVGTTTIGRKAEWPDWRPPAEMRKREPNLPTMVPAGPFNPMGARAIYLYERGRDTLYRIHGTNNAATLGGFETSGCFRLSNADAIDLYSQIRIGSKVVVTD